MESEVLSDLSSSLEFVYVSVSKVPFCQCMFEHICFPLIANHLYVYMSIAHIDSPAAPHQADAEEERKMEDDIKKAEEGDRAARKRVDAARLDSLQKKQVCARGCFGA